MKNTEITIFILAIIIIIFGPLASIWSLNTLFPALAIEYSFSTWLAVFVLSGALGTAFKSVIGK